MFTLNWTEEASGQYKLLKKAANDSQKARKERRKAKSTPAEGLFKQVQKTIQNLARNPKHPGLQTHKYSSLKHPFDDKADVFEAYAHSQTPGAYRVFWCYGPNKKQITIVAITAHP